MNQRKTLQALLIIGFLFTATAGVARDYIIYSIVQNLPMGEPNEIIKKNFYVNIGAKQGVEHGTVLDVHRTVSRLDPYETKKRYNHKVKIGEIQVIHTEDNSAIGAIKLFNDKQEDPLVEIQSLMIGDQVSVKVE